LVGTKTVISLLVVAVAAGAIGYGVGRLAMPPQQITVTTATSTVSEGLPQTFPPSSNSTAIIRNQMLFNGSISLQMSIDKPVYWPGENVHIRVTVTNRSPTEVSLQLYPSILIYNESEKAIWAYPQIDFYDAAGYPILRGPSTPIPLKLSPTETATIDELTKDWNLTGLHIDSVSAPGFSQSKILYDDHPVPEGQYTAALKLFIGVQEGSRTTSQLINENIKFEVRKAATTYSTATTSTITKTTATTLPVVITMTTTEKAETTEAPLYVWAISATATSAVLAVILLIKRR
jgi:hypothetical protein